MKNATRLVTIVLILASPLTAQTSPNVKERVAAREPEEPRNRGCATDAVSRLGEYGREIREIANAARDYVAARLKDKPTQDKWAAVFDIDETALSNWDAMSGCGFCSYSVEVKLFSDAHDPAIIPVLELFNFVEKNGIAVYLFDGTKQPRT